MVKINWTDSALEELANIGDHISRDSIKYAELTVSELFDYPDILEKYPKLGKKVEEYNEPNLRQLIKGSYRIIYKIISDEKIDIITVHNCARLLNDELLKGRR